MAQHVKTEVGNEVENEDDENENEEDQCNGLQPLCVQV